MSVVSPIGLCREHVVALKKFSFTSQYLGHLLEAENLRFEIL